MEKKLNVDINIEGTTITHFSSFMLKQRFNEHHYFELRFNHDQLGMPGMVTLEQSRNFIGKNLSVQFSAAEGEQVFVGKITKVELAQSHGYHGILIVSGYSPTILLERGPDLGSYLGKDLASIVQIATEDAPANDLNMQVNPARSAPIDYIIQYRESDFDFLNRLSAEYHEWFFYDGVNLHFGKPSQPRAEVSLVYGQDIHSLQYGMSITPLKYRRFAYNPKEDELLQAESKGEAGGQPDLVHAVKASNEVYSKVYNQPTAIRVDSKSDIDSHVSNEQKAKVGELLKVSASGDNPGVRLGGIVDISMSVQQGVGEFTTEALGKFLVTGVYHELDGVGHYHNTFEAVVADTERIVVKDFNKPEPDLQLADVVDNNDPQKQGRIKVQFKWQCNSNDPTEWLRVVSPNAGNGDTGGNRGFFVVPERGDQVVVAFEEGNIARPVVLGSVYSGKTANSGGFSNSGTKAFNSRKGSTLTFNDAGHALMLQTSPNASMQMDNSGTVNVNASESFTVTCGQSSFTLKQDGTISLKGIKLTIEGETSTDINKDKGETTLGNSTKHTNINGDNLIATGNTTVVKSNGQMNINGDHLVNIKSNNVKIN